MKKLMIATAIAASMAGAAQATVWNADSNVKLSGARPQLFFAGQDLLDPSCATPLVTPQIAGISIGGTVDDVGGTANTVVNSALTLDGQVAFDSNCTSGGPSALPVLLNFHLNSGVAGATGVTFTGGVVDIYLYTSGTWVQIGPLVASSTNVPCVAADGIPITSGLALNTPPVATVVTLPGPVPANPTCSINLTSTFGGVATLYLDGTVALVPN